MKGFGDFGANPPAVPPAAPAAAAPKSNAGLVAGILGGIAVIGGGIALAAAGGKSRGARPGRIGHSPARRPPPCGCGR